MSVYRIADLNIKIENKGNQEKAGHRAEQPGKYHISHRDYLRYGKL